MAKHLTLRILSDLGLALIIPLIGLIVLSVATTDIYVTAVITGVFMLMLSVVLFIGHSFEILEKVANDKISFVNVLLPIFLIVFSLSLIFCTYYGLLYILDTASFVNVNTESNFKTFVDFFLFSLGQFTASSPSNIAPDSMTAKALVTFQGLSVFMLLVMILANFREFKSSK